MKDKHSDLAEGKKAEPGMLQLSSSTSGSTSKQIAIRGGMNRPRGRGRGRPPGRSYGVGRRPVEQSTSVGVTSATAKDAAKPSTLKAESKV